jgi:hypothetical protein
MHEGLAGASMDALNVDPEGVLVYGKPPWSVPMSETDYREASHRWVRALGKRGLGVVAAFFASVALASCSSGGTAATAGPGKTGAHSSIAQQRCVSAVTAHLTDYANINVSARATGIPFTSASWSSEWIAANGGPLSPTTIAYGAAYDGWSRITVENQVPLLKAVDQLKPDIAELCRAEVVKAGTQPMGSPSPPDSHYSNTSPGTDSCSKATPCGQTTRSPGLSASAEATPSSATGATVAQGGVEWPNVVSLDCSQAVSPTPLARVEATGDVSGDGVPDAVVISECPASTSSWPQVVSAYDGASAASAPFWTTALAPTSAGSTDAAFGSLMKPSWSVAALMHLLIPMPSLPKPSRGPSTGTAPRSCAPSQKRSAYAEQEKMPPTEHQFFSRLDRDPTAR